MTENADLQSRVQEVDELQQQLQSSEREKHTIRQQLTRAEETIRREQQQNQEMRQQVSLVCGVYILCVVTRGPPVTAGD